MAPSKVWYLTVDYQKKAFAKPFSLYIQNDLDDITDLLRQIKQDNPADLKDIDARHLVVWRCKKTKLFADRSTPNEIQTVLKEMDLYDENQAIQLLNGAIVAKLELEAFEVLLVQTPKPAAHEGLETSQEDTVPELPERKAFDNIVTHTLNGNTPSEGAKNPKYMDSQKHEPKAIYDGRNAAEGPPRIAPPIYIYHPSFPEFTCAANNPDERPSAEDLLNAQTLMETISVLYRSENEYKSHLTEPLKMVLKFELKGGSNNASSRTRVDLMGTKPLNDETADNAGEAKADNARNKSKGKKCDCAHEIAVILIEMKINPGEGGSDATTQVGLSYRWIWADELRRKIREKCCCPTFMIGAAGPYFCVLGAVFTDKVIVQRLTDFIWAGLGSTEEEWRVVKIARVFAALRKCLHKLDDFYTEVAASEVSPLDGAILEPRFFPYPNYYPVGTKSNIKFRYIRALEPNEPTCVTFLARREDNELIVVKFVSRYGTRVHEYLAGKQSAPKLHYIGPLPDSGEKRTIPQDGDRDITSKDEGLMWMVVMEYVDSKRAAPTNALQQLRTILQDLHGAGYVFGDLRRPNVLVNKDDKVVLIDFNWAGKHDDTRKTRSSKSSNSNQSPGKRQSYVKYPLAISQVEGMWAEGVSGGAYIRPEHDMEMLSRFEF